MISYIVESMLKPIHEFIRKVQFHCKSRCCCDCMEVSAVIFRRSCSRCYVHV